MLPSARTASILCVAVLWIIAAGTTVLRAAAAAGQGTPRELAQHIFEATGVQGGLIVHLGGGDGKLIAALRADDRFLVQGLEADASHVEAARSYLRSLGVYGKVTVGLWTGKRLPYIDNVVNLLVSENPSGVPAEEVMRVLAPGGVAYLKQAGAWTKTVKPRTPNTDEWTHYLHDPSNNPVAHDTVIGPPRRLQWLAGPLYSRHHDRMSSVSAVVSAQGRVFTILDEGPTFSILVPPRWALVARDAFNGKTLWRRPLESWHTTLWPLKSGPADLPRRLVAVGDRVYAVLSADGPLTSLDAATGSVVRTYEGTGAVEEILSCDGVLLLLANPHAKSSEYASSKRFSRGYSDKFWDGLPRRIMAVEPETGRTLWTSERTALPVTLAADRGRVFLHDGQAVVCLDQATGQQRWRSAPVASPKVIRSFYAPNLVASGDVVLFAAGEGLASQTGSWLRKTDDVLTALAADTGKVLWTANDPPSGYRSPGDVLVTGGLVWTGQTHSGESEGILTGRDPRTGEVKSEFPPDVSTYWFHHRCYRAKATDRFLLMSRTGIEFVDFEQKHWDINHWVRGACLYGVMPANGLIYAPPHPCACYLEAKLSGFNALAPASRAESRKPKAQDGNPKAEKENPKAEQSPRLQRGPAFSPIPSPQSPVPSPTDWPTYRHDPARSGRASTPVGDGLRRDWEVALGGRLTSPVIAEGRLFVADTATHAVHALDAGSGRRLWSYTAGGKVDSPPTIWQGRVLFGSADGWVYCLRADDGVLAWRFRVAPSDEQLVAFDQVESVWPVHGSVLVENGVAWCVAGRSAFLDGGMTLWRLDPRTGEALSQTVLDDKDPQSGKDLQAYVSWLNMPTALPDILSTDGRLVYMRSQPFAMDGKRLPLVPMPRGKSADQGAPPPTQYREHLHLFSPTGFLDDTWWHRTYWLYGSTFVSGWCGYYLAGQAAPAGRILVFDDQRVYGFGRKPKYYRWTTPKEDHLFAAEKIAPPPAQESDAAAKPSRVKVPKSPSLNPAKSPWSVEAWIKSDRPDGVVLARGGGIHGYALYLRGGVPHFAIRSTEKLTSVAGPVKVLGRWVHLAGVLTADKELQLYIDGQLAASAGTPQLITADPAVAMQIGADEGGAGPCQAPCPFEGVIDEVRIYRRALSEEEIRGHAAATTAPATKEGLVLAYPFDRPDAIDSSGQKNDGTVEGVQVVEGKIGRALRFNGKGGAGGQYRVQLAWTQDVPLLVRAMVLSGERLVVAGPPKLIDEEQAFKHFDDPEVKKTLASQEAAWQGSQGGLLRIVSTVDGHTIAETRLDAPPVFDALAAAGKRLYLSTLDGKVLSFAEP